VHSQLIIRGVVSAALLVLGCAASAAAKQPIDNLPLRCAGPACTKVATAVAWPDARLEEGTTPFSVQGAFNVRLPKDPTEYILQGENGITARYTDGRWIGIQVMNAASAQAPQRGDTRNAKPDALSYSDLPRILYTKTPADPEPTRAEDRQIWRLALAFKNSTFENATQVHVTERGPLVVYFADAGSAGTTGDIQVVHRRIKDSYVFVQVKGFSFDDVRRVIGSIEAKRE
jgi:hypothetical protein